MRISKITMFAAAVLFSSTAVAQTGETSNHWALVLKIGEALADDAEITDAVLKTARLKLSSMGATVATSEQVEEARTALSMAEVSAERLATLLDAVEATRGLLFEVEGDGERLTLIVSCYDKKFGTWTRVKIKPAPRPALKRNVRKKVVEFTKPVKAKRRPKGAEPGEIMKMGISLASFDSQEAKDLGVKKPTGARVIAISDTGVIKHSDLAVDDVITKIDKKKVLTPIDAVALLHQARSGDALALEVWRGGEKIAVELAVAEPSGAAEPTAKDDGPISSDVSTPANKDAAKVTTPSEAAKPPPTRKLGVRVRAVTPEIATSHGLPAPMGAFVVFVASGSAAQKAQLKANDIILTINEKSVSHARELMPTVDATYPRQRLRLGIWRNKSQTTIDVDLPKDPTSNAEKATTPTTSSATTP